MIYMKLKHFDHDGRARFVTFGVHRRIPALTDDTFRRFVIRCIDYIRNDYELRLIGYVIMPEHIHLVLIPPDEVKLGYVIGEMKRISARQINRHLDATSSDLTNRFMVNRNGREKFAFWQRRCFDHNCRSDKAMWSGVEYCHNNPVLRSLVAEPRDWLWSSYRWYAGDRDAVLRMDVDLD